VIDPRPASQKQEKRVAKRMGARQHGGSGSGQWWRNDMHTDRFWVECKRTDNERYIRIDLKEVKALVKRAAEKGKTAVLALEIHGCEYVLLQDSDFQELAE
jgi:hypothetical protein